MLIRQAQSVDAQTASELIFSSAQNLLALMFNINDEINARGFLKSAFSQQDGQFGYGNHWVIEKNDQVVATASAWHCELTKVFHRATMQSITDYYGINHTLEVIQRCKVLQDIFPAPQEADWCIGHFAVSALHQRQGLGTHLIEYMKKLALCKGKNSLTLDVESANHAAQVFYQKQGFRIANQATGQQLHGAALGPYTHMVLPL